MLSSSSSTPYYSLASLAAVGSIAVLYSLTAQFFLQVTRCRRILEQPLPPASTKNRRRRVAIVTGSNTGVGFETARALAVTYGYTVILACRSRDKAAAAATRIRAQGGDAVFVHPLDLASFASVREFARRVQEEYAEIHVLVNNAGRNTSGVSERNLDLLFQSNFLGHFLLTAELMEVLLASGSSGNGKARIVNLSSVMHHFCGGVGDLTDCQVWKRTAKAESAQNAYALSKLAALLFTGELNRRYGGGKILSIAVNPGVVNSDIWRDYPRILAPLQSLLYLNSVQGSHTSVAACVLPEDHVDISAAAVDDDEHHFYPYLQPYWLPVAAWDNGRLFPALEVMGPYQGYRRTRPRLPVDSLGAGQALWEAAQELTGAPQWP